MRLVLQHHVFNSFELHNIYAKTKKTLEIYKTALGGKVLFSGGEGKEDLIRVLSCREKVIISLIKPPVLNLSECPKRAANAIHLVAVSGKGHICFFIILMSD